VLIGTWTGEFDRDKARAVFAGEDPFDENTMLDSPDDPPPALPAAATDAVPATSAPASAAPAS
jgi:aerobic C4-dicarboxylate transport protein